MAIVLKEKPIIMIGAERSGTTLVMAMLGCHPRIAVPEVVWYYSRFRPYLYTYGDLSKDENFRTLAEEMVFGLKTPFWGMKVNPRTIVDEIISDVKEKSFAGIYCAMHERFAREAGGKPRWGEKTPYNLFFVKEILEDFPNAQLIFITRDGRDASADYLESAFGPTNIFCATEVWKMCQNAVKPWREKLGSSQWMDVKYETLVKEPEKILKQVCDFLGEKYDPAMLEFYKTDLAKARGATKDHKPLGHATSDKYIGIYKELLSLKEQRIFAAVAGKELAEAGYELDVQPIEIGKEEEELFRELDGRIRAATMDAPEGHIVYESYNDWLVDQREERKRKGIWKDSDVPKNQFPIGHQHEELIMGQRAWRRWKEYLCVKRRYVGKAAL
ncbi:sulfotransferase family protein [Dissulfurispira sp.]|uniref:sulfotransferase family protein n=1 Tax=Dissulfurispira sp. TaxID=2817609 RepID=UPI003FA52A3F